MDASAILDLFRELTAELVETLGGLEDWGETGARDQDSNTQYTHDVVADELLVPRLLAHGFTVVSEETGRQGDGEVVVVVDPIDGSTNAARGLPWYATSMCAVDAEGALVGHVANLAVGDTYSAVRAEGAQVHHGDAAGGGSGGGGDGRCVSRSLSASGCDRLADAVLAFSGLPPQHGGWSQFRVFGAAALDLCAVASGRFDGFVDPLRAHAPWDYMAAMLICREAGAIVGALDGEVLDSTEPGVRRGPVAAATPELFDQLLAMSSKWDRQEID